jgi:cobalt/nickel transport system ATP-binding protein
MPSFVTVQNLSHHYPNGRKALDSISLALQSDESVALVGPNGAGKSTLFFRLAGILPGTKGMIEVGGLDPAAHPPNFPEMVGILFQNADDQLFCSTVADDVAFGPVNLGWDRERIPKAVALQLERLGLTGLSDRPPFQLSGGEKRRAAMAAMMVLEPKLLLLDEPTAHLDPRGRREFIETARSLSGCLLMATHDLELALDLCPRTILLDHGRLIADGPTSSILADPTLMSDHGLEVPWRLKR